MSTGQLGFPTVYASARAGRASLTHRRTVSCRTGPPRSLFSRRPGTIAAPTCDGQVPLKAHVTNLDASLFLGRLALCRVDNGTIKKPQQAPWCRADGTLERVKITELLMTEALEPKPVDSAGPGDIIALAVIPEITIGERLADPENPIPLPIITVDETAIWMTIGTSDFGCATGEVLEPLVPSCTLSLERVLELCGERVRRGHSDRGAYRQARGIAKLALARLERARTVAGTKTAAKA